VEGHHRSPTIGRLDGERKREFVLADELEETYLAAAPRPLRDATLLMLDTGVRVGGASQLAWTEVFLKPPSAPGTATSASARASR
jgi:hypothetical protein